MTPNGGILYFERIFTSQWRFWVYSNNIYSQSDTILLIGANNINVKHIFYFHVAPSNRHWWTALRYNLL